MKEILKLHGLYVIESFDAQGNLLSKVEKKNLVTQNMFTGFFKFLNQALDAPAIDSLNLTHIAIGTGTNAALKTDTLLQTETFRKALASKTYNSETFVSKTSIQAAEGNPAGGIIREVACFAKATDTANSGLLVSRANVVIEKNANIKLVITWFLTAI